MSFTRFASSVALTCTALAVALPGCSSDQPEPGIGNVDMAVTLATPPSGPNEQIDTVEVSFWCEGVDPVLGVPRPQEGAPETFSVNTSTSQGPEPKNTIGLFEKQGIPAGDCEFTFSAASNTGNTECNGEITVAVVTNETTSFEVVLACIHTPRYGGVRGDGTFNQCAEYRQILVTPTTQSVGNLVDVRTEVYDPDGVIDPVTVEVTTEGACGNVATVGSDTAASCETVSGCEAVVNTVECTGVGDCEIIVRVSDDGFDSCNGFLFDGSNNNAARQTIAVDCAEPAGCGNGTVEPGEDCEPPNTAFCDANCQDIFVCPPEASDPCVDSTECNPQTCAADENNQPVCSDNPQTGGTCDLTPDSGAQDGFCDAGQCVTCTQDSQCDDGNECTADVCNAGTCENANVADGTSCDDGAGTCNAGVCEGAGLVCEYEQDFEAMVPGDPPQPVPNSLSDDGWLVGANVFAPDGTTFLYDYFAFPAPNGGAGFSAVAVGEGGPEQGAQQLSIYNDYNNADHGVGNIIEAIVFRERTLVASDIGTILTFTFDGKRGNIEGASTALAFVKTLDPGAGFATTNFITEDTTALPTDWATYTITLDLSDPALEGQILQYGYQTRASNFEGSGNFYDNISVGPEGCGGGGGGECMVDGDCPGTGNDCTAAVCNAGVCETANVADGTSCDGDTGTCNAGVCEPTAAIACEYGQDFEAMVPGDPPQPVPNSLSEDGWLVGANVFAPDGTTFLYDYFAFPAPNGGAGFSAVAVGEGGPEQGEQQLSIYNDYNNADHGVGNIIEAIVFRERTIVASDVGTTLEFTFDAKAGNIEGASTALAFVKTLDPGAGFATIDNITQDTTSLPATWGTFTLSLVVDASKVGYILQYGFQTRASNFEGSGNFYDNLSVGPTGCVVDNGGGGGPSGELTVNGDFETGDFTGWTNFCDNASCTITDQNPNGGQFAANVNVANANQAGVIKQEFLAEGQIAAGDPLSISLFVRGEVGAGGLLFVTLFSELPGGGVTNRQDFGPFFPTADWVEIPINTTVGGDASGGITLELAAQSGASFINLFVDDVSVTVP